MDAAKLELIIMAISLSLDAIVKLVEQLKSKQIVLTSEQLESLIAARRQEIDQLKQEIDALGGA